MCEVLKIWPERNENIVVKGSRTTTATTTPREVDEDLACVIYRQRAFQLQRFFYRRTRDADATSYLLAETFASAAIHRKHQHDLTLDNPEWIRNIAKLELSRYFRRLRVEARNVERLGLTVPMMTEEEASDLEREIERSEQKRMDLTAT